MRLRVSLCLTLLLTLAGCSLKPAWPKPGSVAANAVEATDPIELRIEGSPIDETDDPCQQLTLQTALARALHTDPRIQAAIGRVRIAYAEAQQARLLPNPVVSVVLKYPEAGGAPGIEGGIAADLLSLLQIPGRVRAADHRLRAAAAEAVRSVLDVAAEIQETYAAVQALDEQLPLLRQRLALIERLYAIAEARLNAGEAGRLELVTFAAERAAIEAEQDELLLDRREQRLRLARLIGQPSGEVDWQLEPWREPPQQSVSEQPWIAVALVHRPQLQQIAWELAALGEEVKQAKWSAFDGADAGVEGERDGGEWSYGPAISSPIPVFDWGQARTAGAKASVIQTRHALVQAQREVVEEVRRACASFNESVHELRRAREQLLPLQQERRDLVEAAYRAGHTDVTAVIFADQDLADARGKIVALEQRVTTSLIALHRAVGGQGIASELVEQSPDSISSEVVSIEQSETAVNRNIQ